jgi:hypothetical protein
VTQESRNSPAVISKDDAHALLKAHGFERLHIAIAPPERWELWQNSRGKTVQIEFSDDTPNFFWRDSLDEALKQKDANPIRL